MVSRSSNNVDIKFNKPRRSTVRDIVIEFRNGASFVIIRVPETELNTWTKYGLWARVHVALGKEVLDAVWHFCQREYHTGGAQKQL